MRLTVKRIYLFSQKNVKSRRHKSCNFKDLSFHHDFTTSTISGKTWSKQSRHMVKVVKVKMVKMIFRLHFKLTIIIYIIIYIIIVALFANPKTILTK